MFSTIRSEAGSANRYLLAYERLVIAVHSHSAILLGPSFVVLAALAAAGAAASYLKSSPEAVAAVWLTWAFVLLYLVGRIGRWFSDLFVVTSDRLLVIRGMLARDVASIPISRAAGMKLRRSFTGRLLGYGHFIFESSGRDQAIRAIRFVPYPEQLYLEIKGLVYPDRDRDRAD
jgi:membrane protein YdbS with pleckstrin-like domain